MDYSSSFFVRSLCGFLPLIVQAVLFPGCSHAQDSGDVFTRMPGPYGAASGYEDLYVRYRPALSVNGFDCAAEGLDCRHGLGVKQILQRIHEPARNEVETRVFRALVDLALEDLDPPTTRAFVSKNAHRAQSVAFLALVTLILEQHRVDGRLFLRTERLPSHEAAARKLLTILQDLNHIRIRAALPGERGTDDAVKWTGALGSMARFVDLYLALDDAYAFYGMEPAALFGCERKHALLRHLEEQARLVDDMGNTPVVELEFLDQVGLPADFSGVDYDEVQAGNWTLKVHISVGYAALAQQRPLTEGCGERLVEPEATYDHWVHRARRSAAGDDARQRKHQWAYQTGGGRRFWAEGPYYFNYALVTAVPFWHAYRAQYPASTELQAPFEADFFLNPLRGYADLVTPEGGVPPLEDGNKIPMEAAFLLQWDSTYSADKTLGRRFAWIADAQDALPSEDLWLTMLSIPLADRGLPPPEELVPQSGQKDRHQIVLRRDGGTGSCERLPGDRSAPCHYVLLNGEQAPGIEPGEGHEQSDQMQLLYYVDDVSFLLDTGYDNAPGIQNSTWNEYRFHNVLGVYDTSGGADHGGLAGPLPDVRCPIIAPCEVGLFADHAPVATWHHDRYGRLDRLDASINLSTRYPGEAPDATVTYDRTVLFVDDERTPYLVDINAAVPASSDPLVPAESLRYVMHFFLNAEHTGEPSGTSNAFLAHRVWGAPASFGAMPEPTGHALALQYFSIDRGVQARSYPDLAREPFIRGLSRGEGVPITRVELETDPRPLRGFDATEKGGVTIVAFLQPRLDGVSGFTDACAAHVVDLSAKAGAPAGLYAWQHAPDVLDFVVVRSAGSDLSTALEVSVDAAFPVDFGAWTPAEAFQTPGATLSRTERTLRLEAGRRLGFVRLRHPGADPACVATAVESAEGDAAFEVEWYPNPVVRATEAAFTAPEGGRVRVDLYDLLGRHVEQIRDAWLPAGRHTVGWEASGVPPGVYIYRLQIGMKAVTGRLTIL